MYIFKQFSTRSEVHLTLPPA